ncbi:hypothetical protein MLD38_035176 [Melastoma candidum]|uniref:Uncharacterized protein n=1 Tax=Melastoma candidum TaxID=119954 RepID=A0ACB9MCR5_9MYRT|nr:hypothetical protein MLD38_035176 [Melastoma candidum]
MDICHYHNTVEGGGSSGSNDALLPPGFRFHPTDEELITYYLLRKVLDGSFTGRAFAEVDLNKCEPWELPGKAKMGEKEWYFFSLRDRKYPTGLRTNRATGAGYWKATGKDREIYSSKTCSLVGMKKTLVFYRGRAPKGEKSSWVMHEYRLEGKFSYHFISRSSKDEWVISRLFQKSGSVGGCSGATCSGGSSGKKNRVLPPISIGRALTYQDVNSSSTASLPPLYEPLPYSSACAAIPDVAFTDRETSSIDSSPVLKEHVSCFSTAAHSAAVLPYNNYAQGSPIFPLGNPLSVFNGFGSSSSRTPKSSGNGTLSGFPSLRSLQENLQSPLSFGGAAIGQSANGTLCEPPPTWCLGSWGLQLDERRADECETRRALVSSSELDCIWRSH